MRGTLKNLLVNLSIATVSLLVFALLAELALQVAMPLFFRPRITRVDPALGWYHNPSVTNAEELEGHRYQLSYNSHGFRVPEHALEKPAGVRRVLVLGDSYVDGSEVDDRETFTWLLQSCLAGVEVINLGVYGFSTAQQFVALEKFGLAYRPDLVLLVSITNDFVENVLGLQSFGVAPRFVLDGDGLAFEGTDHPNARALFRETNLPAPRFVHQHSLLYYVANHYVYHRLIAGRIDAIQKERVATVAPADREELFRRIVLRMRDLAAANGADFAVVFASMRNELKGEGSPQAGVATRLRADGVHTVDLFSALREAEQQGSGESHYYREDIHWNARGHRVVAGLLRSVVEGWAAADDPRFDDPKLGGSACEPPSQASSISR